MNTLIATGVKPPPKKKKLLWNNHSEVFFSGLPSDDVRISCLLELSYSTAIATFGLYQTQVELKANSFHPNNLIYFIPSITPLQNTPFNFSTVPCNLPVKHS